MKRIKNYQDFTNEEINWRKGLTTGALAAGMALGNTAKSQNINTTSVIKREPYVSAPYDSTSNFVSKTDYKGSYDKEKEMPHLKQLIGQTFFFKPVDYNGFLSSSKIDIYQYTTTIKKGFSTKQTSSKDFDSFREELIGKKLIVKSNNTKDWSYSWKFYKKPYEDLRYKKSIDINDLFEREFTVSDIIKVNNRYYLELIDNASNKIYFDTYHSFSSIKTLNELRYIDIHENHWPFIGLKEMLTVQLPDKVTAPDTTNKYNKVDGNLLSNKYFDVVDITYGNENLSNSEIFVVLKDKETDSVYYYKYPDKEEYFPFVIGGFYVKQSQLLSGSYLNVVRSNEYFDLKDLRLLKGGKVLNKNVLGSLRPIETPGGEDAFVFVEDFKFGTKLYFDGLIIDVNQQGSPLCAIFKNGDKKYIKPLSELFTDENKELSGTGLYYPSYYSNITVNFSINVNIYR